MAHSTLPSLDERAGPKVDRLTVHDRPLTLGLFLSLRPSQWTKNLFVFFGLLFGQRLLDPRASRQSLRARSSIFCVLSGVVYLVNDVADRDADRQPPTKRFRPIASGAVSPATALVFAACADGRRARRGLAGCGRRLPRTAVDVRRPAGALFRTAQARRHHRRADDLDRVRAACGRRRGRDRRADQPLAADPDDSARALSWPWRSGGTSWCCSPTAPRAIGRSSRNTARICSIR